MTETADQHRRADQPRRKATRKDVARRAGVSVAVVSYTLNGGAPVAPATAKRVLEAVAALGYQPNRTAQALKSGSAKTIALIMPETTNPFFTKFGHAVEAAARRRGYALYMTTSPDHSVVAPRFREFAARQVDGVLLLPHDSPVESAELDQAGIPWLIMNAQVPSDGAASIGVNLYGGAVEATRHLIAHGHRGIAYLGDVGDNAPRHRGWRDACEAAGVEPGPAIEVPFLREGGYEGGRALLALPELPSAVFAASDMIAVGLLRALHEAGTRIPEDIAVISFDDSWESEYSWPPLSTVRQPVSEMADEAIEQLLNAPRPEPGHRTFQGTLILRRSCGPHPEE